jgi:hypothetical protein
VYGGARIHVAGGTQSLPIEQATGMMDDSVFDLIWQYAQQGTGEICGLWNSREISGYGIGSIFLTRAAVTISNQIGIKSLFALCAPYTIKLAEAVGYKIDYRIGNKGTFYYPKLDLLATTMILDDVNSLVNANIEHRTTIMQLRSNPNQVRIEELRNKRIEIHYTLDVPNLDSWDLLAIIKNMQPTVTASISKDLNIL